MHSRQALLTQSINPLAFLPRASENSPHRSADPQCQVAIRSNLRAGFGEDAASFIHRLVWVLPGPSGNTAVTAWAGLDRSQGQGEAAPRPVFQWVQTDWWSWSALWTPRPAIKGLSLDCIGEVEAEVC